MDSPFIHAPLDPRSTEFRIVELQACGPTDIVRCRLTTHQLPPSFPQYVTLSFMWDHISPKDTIELNGVHVQVGHSLWTFFNQTRLQKTFTT
jgi:hypothetical protein